MQLNKHAKTKEDSQVDRRLKLQKKSNHVHTMFTKLENMKYLCLIFLVVPNEACDLYLSEGKLRRIIFLSL